MAGLVELLPAATVCLFVVLVAVALGKLATRAHHAEFVQIAMRYGAAVHRASKQHWYFDALIHGVTVRIRRVHTPGGRINALVQTAEIGLPAPTSPFSAVVQFSNSSWAPGFQRDFARLFTLDIHDVPSFLALFPIDAQANIARLAGTIAFGSLTCNGVAIVYRPGSDLIENLDDVLALMAGVWHRASGRCTT